MALIKCKECSKEVSSKAGKCPHCGCKVESDADRVFNLIGRISKIIIALVFGTIFLWAYCSGGNEETGSSMNWELYYSYKHTKEEVLKKLKAPSTAKFADFSKIKYRDNGDGTYIIESYVDSQNSFGATIRTRFRCTTTSTGTCKGLIFYD